MLLSKQEVEVASMYSIELLRCYFHSHAIKIIGLVLIGLLLLMLATPADSALPSACPAHAPPVSDTGDVDKNFLETTRMFFRIHLSINPCVVRP